MADLKNHSQCHYHKSSADVIRHFLQTYKNSSCRIDNILDSKLKAQVANNPKILTSFLKCIEFCCRQGIPLRSNRDDDTTFDNNTTMGNSKELLKLFCDLENDELKEHHVRRMQNIHLKQHRMNF